MSKRDAVVARHFQRLGITNERYRIITLIENQMSDYEQGSEEFDVLADAVALIQGDDK
jgi:DNA-dependent RNA polymerase auxiliary subunit epsilon